MKRTLRAVLQLIRLPNLFTAMADSLAGYLLAGEAVSYSVAAKLMLCSYCLYAAGIALNDLCDLKQDRTERPDRPLPSGDISVQSAVVLILLLFAAGLTLANSIGRNVFLTAAILTVAIIAYDALLKSTWIGPLGMGSCRALNLLLGAVAVGAMWSIAVLPAGLMLLYVASLTLFARSETSLSRRSILLAATSGMIVALSGLALLPLLLPTLHYVYLVFVAFMIALVARCGLRAAQSTLPAHVQQAVTVFVLGIVGFDACLVTAARGPVAGATVALLLIPAVWARSLARVT